MGGIFISYRREDSSGYAIPLYERLVQRFGEDQIFKDIEDIELGVDFVENINRALGSCNVLLALIGKNWIHAATDKNQPRIHDPNDFVGIEIKTALEREIRVIPVLVGGGSMPSSEDLPASLDKLSRKQAIEISDTRFQYDMDKLIKSLESIIEPVEKGPSSWLTSKWIYAVLGGVVAVLALVFLFKKPEPVNRPVTPAPSILNVAPGYVLNLRGVSRTSDPSVDQISDAIESLAGGVDDFAILARTDSEQRYVQVHGGPNKFQLEYRDGFEHEHFKCEASKAETVSAFIAYKGGDEDFRSVCRWQQLDLQPD